MDRQNGRRARDRGEDLSYYRPEDTLTPMAKAPVYASLCVPAMLTTDGGPVRGVGGEILDPDGNPIPGLYSAGEFGSVWGNLYEGAGNVDASDFEAVFESSFEERLAALNLVEPLSPRETEVASLVLRGNTVPAIARKLFISENTVRGHTKAIYRKLNVNNKTLALKEFQKIKHPQWEG